jgi:hypothetical protein
VPSDMSKAIYYLNLVPFIIDEDLKMYYYRGLREWSSERDYLTDTCLSAQDKFKQYLEYFRIGHKNKQGAVLKTYLQFSLIVVRLFIMIVSCVITDTILRKGNHSPHTSYVYYGEQLPFS